MTVALFPRSGLFLFKSTDPTATPEQLSARFGRKNAKRTEQIEGIIETLRGLGQV